MVTLDTAKNSGVMIAYLPVEAYWCRQELPHMTLVYAGTTDQLTPGDYNALAKDTATISALSQPFGLKVLSPEVFGDEEKVDVLTLDPSPSVKAARSIVERWDRSEHPFTPHVTIGPSSGIPVETSSLPMVIWFNQIMVAWGDESMTFKL